MRRIAITLAILIVFFIGSLSIRIGMGGMVMNTLNAASQEMANDMGCMPMGCAPHQGAMQGNCLTHCLIAGGLQSLGNTTLAVFFSIGLAALAFAILFFYAAPLALNHKRFTDSIAKLILHRHLETVVLRN